MQHTIPCSEPVAMAAVYGRGLGDQLIAAKHYDAVAFLSSGSVTQRWRGGPSMGICIRGSLRRFEMCRATACPLRMCSASGR